MDVTLELGCCKFPPQGDLLSKYMENREALIAFLQQAHIGKLL